MVPPARAARGAGSPIAKAFRRAAMLLGLLAMLGGAGWTVAALSRGAQHPAHLAASTYPETWATGLLPADAAAPRPCVSLRVREIAERESCFHRLREELRSGRIDLDDAVRRLEACADGGGPLAGALERHAALRLERHRAHLAFDEPTGRRAAAEARALAERLGDDGRSLSPAAAARLRRAGLDFAGLAGSDAGELLARLAGSASLRRDVRAVYGARTAEALERHLGPPAADALPAVVVGPRVLVPASVDASPALLSIPEYADRVIDAFDALESARLTYLAAAGEAHRRTGSIGAFIGSLRDEGGDDPARHAAERAAVARAALLAQLDVLERRLGADPAVALLAREGVVESFALSRACETGALRRQVYVRAGAGVVAGLGGAAVMVVAGGVTGTLAGGVTIAAALQAAGGAYLALRSESPPASASDGREQRRDADDPPEEETPFRRLDAAAALGAGEDGPGQGHRDEPLASGEWAEAGGDAGEGEQLDDADEPTELEPRVNTVPAELPPPLDDDSPELPPLLDAAALRRLRPVSLAEAQARIDEFLALGGAATAPPEREPLAATDVEGLIEEAREALRLWVEQRELSAGFGSFFLRAEVEALPPARRADALRRAGERYARDRAAYAGSAGVPELRGRVAQRLVIHCRGGAVRGDLILQACSDPTAMTLVLVAALRDAGIEPPAGTVLGVQARPAGFEPVLYDSGRHEVVSLATGERTGGVVAPIYHPASFYYGFLAERGARPAVDVDAHLLVVRADAPAGGAASLAALQADEDCQERRGWLARTADRIRSLVGLSSSARGQARCAEADPVPSRRQAGGGDRGRSGVQVTIRPPSVPLPASGGGQDGGGGLRGSGGGGSQASASGSRGGGSGSGSGQGASAQGGQSGGRASGSGGAAEGASAGGSAAAAPARTGTGRDGAAADGGKPGEGGSGSSGGGSGSGGTGETGAGPGAPAAQPASDRRAAEAAGGAGSEHGSALGQGEGPGGGQEGGRGAGGSGGAGGDASGESPGGAVRTTPSAAAARADGGAGTSGAAADALLGADGAALDLEHLARASSALGEAAREAAPLRLWPWRVRDDFTFDPSVGGVHYADNARALTRFADDDRFITMSPSVTEEQRRMFAADSFPVAPAGTECGAPGLPPRRVFRRATAEPGGFRYVYCNRQESVVVFRTRDEAMLYARLGAADRPLLLTRLASERIARLEASPRMAMLHALLREPEAVRSLSAADLDSLAVTAADLAWLQQTLESQLFLTMHELQDPALRGPYYEMHRQVAQSPVMLEFVAAVQRFNVRLASDPLRTLAWAGALPGPQRQAFFRLYFTLGSPMYWPHRWETLHRRYGELEPAPAARAAPAQGRSLDFLQVVSDPTRVRVDWYAQHPPVRASLRDRQQRDGAERTAEPVPEVTDADLQEREETTERRRAGTRGLGRAGVGDGLGPERGRRPLQMIRIRVAPESGEPDRMRVPDDNPTRPGGTAGQRRVQERSASRQEPVLWVSPETFIDAVLSGWDQPRGPAAEAGRAPAIVRFGPRLRERFLRDADEENRYEARLGYAMSVLSSGGWLRYTEVREAMGGAWSGARAYDTGRFAAELSHNATIVDQEQVRGTNFFTATSVDLPADLFDRVRKAFSRYGAGSFDLEQLPGSAPVPLPDPDAASAERLAAREELLRGLRLISQQTRSAR
jgi:hypothetical protein